MESVEQLDPTQELTTEVVKERAVKGAVVLTGRMILTQPINLISMVLLTAFLTPAEFGIYFVVSAIKNFLAYFSDIGFAPALIQKKEQLTDVELKTIFTTQQVLVLALILIVILVTPIIQHIYHLNQNALYLLWALLLSLLLSSIKTIPSVLLERRLEFSKLVLPQIVETVIFNVIAVSLAWKGFGVTSYTIAVLVSGLVGVVLIYFIQPWVPGITFSVKAFKSVLKFGIPYQVNSLLAMVKDDGMTLFLGSTLGSSGVGLLAWAQKWAFAPLRFFMDQVIRVTFPAFSRIQDHKDELAGAVTKSISYICLLVFPALVMLVLMAPSLVVVIPKYHKWSGALMALSFLSVNSALAAITTPITNTLNAIGKISATFKLMIMWTVLTWVFVPALAITYGVTGAALGFAIVGLSSIIALVYALKFVAVDYFKALAKPLIISIFVGAVVFVTQMLITVSITQVIISIVLGIITFIVSTVLLEPQILSLFKKNA